ncbi:MAG: right-handed parallel beta-helix repeat-containing protein [Anaerolineales bacterium]|jgi:hypothetical protein
MNKSKVFIKLITIVLFFALCISAQHNALARYGGHVLRVPKDYATIQEAVDAANPGDTIQVGQGEYAGAYIDKPLKIVGKGKRTNIRTGVLHPWGVDTAFLITSDEVEIRKFTIDMGPGFALSGQFADNVTVRDLIIVGADVGIYVVYSANWTITHNKISGLRSNHPLYAAVGIELGQGTEDCLVAGNTITSQYPAEGILLYTHSQTVEHNTVVFNDIEVSITDPVTGIEHPHAHGIGLIDGSAFWGGLDSEEIKNNRIAVNDLRGNERTILQSTPGQMLVYSPPGPANTVECNLGHDPYTEDCEEICQDIEDYLEDLGYDFDCDSYEDDEGDD